jgi:hypothetical protein
MQQKDDSWDRPNRPPDAQNELCEFWVDSMATKWLQYDRDANFIPQFKDWCVLLAIDRKTKEKSYVIHNGKEIVADAKTVELIAIESDKQRLLLQIDGKQKYRKPFSWAHREYTK